LRKAAKADPTVTQCSLIRQFIDAGLAARSAKK